MQKHQPMGVNNKDRMILSGMPEQPWETYDMTREQVVEAIAASMGTKDNIGLKEEAKKVEISCCSRVASINWEN